MGVYERPDSPFLWLLLERPRQRPIREATEIPKNGGSPEGTKEMWRQAQEVYALRMVDFARRRHKLPTTGRRTFVAHRTWYEANVSAHKRGVSRERSMLRKLAEFFDRYDLVDIDVERVREWRTWRREAVRSRACSKSSVTSRR